MSVRSYIAGRFDLPGKVVSAEQPFLGVRGNTLGVLLAETRASTALGATHPPAIDGRDGRSSTRYAKVHRLCTRIKTCSAPKIINLAQ